MHIHARQPDGRPAFDVATYAQIDAEVRQRCPDVVVDYSTGAIGIDRETRIHHIRAIKPDMAALNIELDELRHLLAPAKDVLSRPRLCQSV